MNLTCPSCGETYAAGDSFCEACGGSLEGGEQRVNPSADPERTVLVEIASTGDLGAAGDAADDVGAADDLGGDCPACHRPGSVGGDGYCQECGMLVVRERDHLEFDAGPAGGVTDRGKRHHRNEDALWMGPVGSGAILAVLADGVSSSIDPDLASAAAVEAAGASLVAADVSTRACVAAAVAAGTAVAGLVDGTDPRRGTSNPACTIVTAAWNGSTLFYAWVGDSRIYFVPFDGPVEQLSADDSWAGAAIAAGIEPAVAYADPRSHAITAWLGADAGDIAPQGGAFVPPSEGLALLCSDGLWNYLEDPAALSAKVLELWSRSPVPLELARALCAFACEQGGVDNVTVATWQIGPTDPQSGQDGQTPRSTS